MALSLELLKSMGNEHAINALRADFDPLINTPLEALLIDWCENLLDEAADDEPVRDAMIDHNLETADVVKLADALIESTDTTVALLSALADADITQLDQLVTALAFDDLLDEAGIDTPEILKARLDLGNQFRALANDAGDVFSRLTELTTGATA